ncbi:MAG: hypothetical protein QM780_06325 [Hyphomicrobium sp.]|uniref:hypothetical protein n=1 Tax=Hyphomicrobium sp. TaxID=82 RepID=UPI0039E506E6
MSARGAHNWSEPQQRAIRAQLDRVVNSSSFQQSQRRRRFLEFLVEEALAGRAERLKGYTIAVEVFDRQASFDPAIDPVVRVEAGRLRDKLRDYYYGEGATDPVLIDLPKGSYEPVFDFREPPLEPAPPHNDSGADEPGTQSQVQHLAPKANNLPPRRNVIIAAFLAAAIGSFVWWQSAVRSPSVSTPIDGSKGPVVAVMPFANLSGDPKQEYFSDGLTEDILTELSRARDLVVLSRDRTFPLKGQPMNATTLGHELKANYVLEGSIQRSGDRLRVTAQLIDAETGQHVWADRLDRQMSDLLVVQDAIVSEIVAKLTGGYGVISVAESSSAKRKSQDEIKAYDLVLRAQDAMRPEWSRETFATAKGLLRQAIALDPMNARALRELAYLSAIGWVFRFDLKPDPQDEIIAQAVKAVQIDPVDARARMVAAAAYFWTSQMDLFERHAQEALRLAPYDAEILAAIGTMYAKSGDWTRGVALVEKANTLNSYAATGWYQSTVAIDAYLKGDAQRALTMLRQSSDQQTFYIYIEYIPIYGRLGRKADALAAWHKLLVEQPDATGETFMQWFRLWNMRDADIASLMDGVRQSEVLTAAHDVGAPN